MKKSIACCFLLLLSVTFAQGQFYRDYLSIGVGPSMIYADNGGDYRAFDFRVRPSVALTYSNHISDNFDLRITAGMQWMSTDPAYSPAQLQGLGDQAKSFSGIAYYGDVMQVFQINPNIPGRRQYWVNYHVGLGFGILHAVREEKAVVQEEMEGYHAPTVARRRASTTPYIPLRLGLTTNMQTRWDYGFELGALTALSSNVDGNNIKHKLLGVDVLLQANFVVKRYLRR